MFLVRREIHQPAFQRRTEPVGGDVVTNCFFRFWRDGLYELPQSSEAHLYVFRKVLNVLVYGLYFQYVASGLHTLILATHGLLRQRYGFIRAPGLRPCVCFPSEEKVNGDGKNGNCEKQNPHRTPSAEKIGGGKNDREDRVFLHSKLSRLRM